MTTPGIDPKLMEALNQASSLELFQLSTIIERLLGEIPSDCALVTVLDGHPAALAWLGSVSGHRVRGLGVEHFGQTGSLAELYKHYGIDANAIIRAAQAIAPGRPIRHLRVAT